MARRMTIGLFMGLILLAGHLLYAHPLGNFAICHYSGLTIGDDAVTVKYIIDMAEIPAFQEMTDIDTDQNKQIDAGERRAYLSRKVEELKKGLMLSVGEQRLSLKTVDTRLEFPPGAGGLATLKLTVTLRAFLKDVAPGRSHRIAYEDNNYPDRLGWKEIVVRSDGAVKLSEVSLPNQDRSRELSQYPEDMLSSPPQDVKTQFNALLPGRPQPIAAAAPVTRAPGDAGALPTAGPQEKTTVEHRTSTEAPPNAPAPRIEAPPAPPSAAVGPAASLSARDDLFTALISKKELNLNILLISLLVAFGLGAFHALSPGHGKTIVAAYLVGSRGTAKHAVFLGAVVTITHTIGVFALGLVTLFASRYIVPEKLYPWLGFASGLTVVGIGLMLFFQRLRGLDDHHHHDHQHPETPHAHAHDHEHELEHAHTGNSAHGHAHAGEPASHAHDNPASVHDTGHGMDHEHGPHDHSHPHGHSHHDHGHHQHHGHDDHGHHHGHHHHDLGNTEVSLKNLLALGISGGIVPCPSALVVLLSAISLHRIGFGLVLILAFSLGLALVLTFIGLLMVYARRFMDQFTGQGCLLRGLPVLSSLVITVLGLIIAVQALVSGGILSISFR